MSHTDNTPTVPKTIRLTDADDDEVVTDPGTGPSVGDADDQEGSVNGDDDDADDNEDAGEEDEDEDEDEDAGEVEGEEDTDEDDGGDDDGEDDEGEEDEDEDGVPKSSSIRSMAKSSSRSKTAPPTHHSMNTPVPPQFFGADDDDISVDDLDDVSASGNVTGDDEYDDDDDDEDPDTYLQKFDLEMNNDLLLSHHPTQFNKNDDEIEALCQISRNTDNNVVDPLHKTIPFLTKYEKTRVLGQRAKQLNAGSKSYVVVPDHVSDGFIIAQMELAQKRIPFIIERPVNGGGCEYWRVRDLEVL